MQSCQPEAMLLVPCPRDNEQPEKRPTNVRQTFDSKDKQNICLSAVVPATSQVRLTNLLLGACWTLETVRGGWMAPEEKLLLPVELLLPARLP